MTIQHYPAELNYVNAKLSDSAGIYQGESFLKNFLDACLRADAENYEIIRSALLIFMDKYPAPVDRLAAEYRD